MTNDANDNAMESLRVELENHLKEARRFPSGPSFKGMSKKLAELTVDAGNESEGIFHFTESHGVSLRLLATHRINISKVNGNEPLKLERKYLTFEGEFNGFEGMKKRLEELPADWTLVQLTCGFQPTERFRLPGERSPMPDMWLTRLPSGKEASSVEPYTRRFEYEVARDEHMLTLLEEIHAIVAENKTKPLSLLNQPRKYWDVRRRLANRMVSVVTEVEQQWLKSWRFLLLGRLMDTKLEKEIRAYVDDFIKQCKWSSISNRTRQLLYRLTEASQELELNEIEEIVAELMDFSANGSKFATNISDRFPKLATAKRKPVILIVDELLDLIPWENTTILKKHPVTRSECLPMLHALYKAHEETIENGHKILENNPKGYFIVNPDNNLPAMEERIKIFLPKRCPTWDGNYGTVVDKRESVKTGLTSSDIFFYSGHGSGQQLFGEADLSRTNIRAVSFLMGCSSNSSRSAGGRLENTGIAQSYHIGSSPCVLGNLWEVSDMDTDRFTVALLHLWLPLDSGMSKDINDYFTDDVTKTQPRYQHEPELLRALVLARNKPQNVMTQFAFVARGLPVKIDIS